MGRLLKQKKDLYLFCPGPVNVALNVKMAANIDMCHREEDFSRVLNELNQNMLSLFEIKKREQYYPVFVTGSSTSANEAVLSSIVPGKKTLILTNGEFGDRLYKIAKIHSAKVDLLDFGWLNEFDLGQIEKYIRKNKIEVVAMVHHETCTGMLNPVREVGELTEKYNILFFVDAVSSIGADEIEIEKSNIAFCTTASGKALGSVPGISTVMGKVSEFAKLKNSKQQTMYLHLYNFYYYSKHYLQTPNTPNVAGFLALNQAVKNIITEGIDVRRSKIRSFAKMIRKELNALGIKRLISRTENLSNILTTFKIPDSISVNELQERLRERNIVIYGGKGPLKDKVFQVANIGDLDYEDLDVLIRAFEEILVPPQANFHKISLEDKKRN